MAIEWKKVTWYSKILAVLIFVLTFFVGYQLGHEKGELDNDSEETIEIQSEAKAKVTSITINYRDIEEANFSGKMPIIIGPADSALVVKANDYIKARVEEFRNQANKDVPDMREKFGADNPTTNYTIEMEAKYIKAEKTESIVISTYAYTGGANGNSSYKTFTVETASGKILNLEDIIKDDKENDLRELVKRKLVEWRPAESSGTVVFEEEVEKLNFTSFSNWSLDGKNLIIYFDKYEIGPGSLGAVAFPISRASLVGYLEASY